MAIQRPRMAQFNSLRDLHQSFDSDEDARRALGEAGVDADQKEHRR
jgi:hypothetical protein